MQKYLKKHFEHKFGNSDKLCTIGAREQVQRGSRNIVLNDARYKKKKKACTTQEKKSLRKEQAVSYAVLCRGSLIACLLGGG